MTVADVVLGDIIPMSFSPSRASQSCWVRTVSAIRVVALQAQQAFVAIYYNFQYNAEILAMLHHCEALASVPEDRV